MIVFVKLWVIVTDITNWLLLSPFSREVNQIPIGGDSDRWNSQLDVTVQPQPPLFQPPGTNDPTFFCNYTNMGAEWSPCNDQDRTCWLKNVNGTTIDITTDYETLTLTPKGTTRFYNLTVNELPINPNGISFPSAQVFNNKFPGPLIEACWGDTLVINVTNQLQYNGTSIHWHGIRQLNTMHMDGVNGKTPASGHNISSSTSHAFLKELRYIEELPSRLSQCPIAPGDSFVYTFSATQYGSSWYHSHFSVQYADGLQGPITIHGPTSAQYDNPIDPLIVGDWMNTSAFEAINMPSNMSVSHPDILLDGRGNINRFNNDTQVNTSMIPAGYEVNFEPTTNTTKYLFRLINTAFATNFVFSIDNHVLQVVEADFVPVKPFTTNAIFIAIGQRYHFIVDTLDPSKIGDGNFWIRTWPVQGPDDYKGVGPNYMNTGILRYNQSSTTDPTSSPWNVSAIISNETDSAFNDQLVPVVKWTVGPAANGQYGEAFVIDYTNGQPPFATAFFALDHANSSGVVPFQTTYGNPTFLNMATNVGDTWPINWVVIPENYTDSWVYMNITSNFLNHPIHLHGHDFAILLQDSTWPPPSNASLKTDDPPRRDVVMVPEGGGAIIAFKSDNPGVWLMHCHIATHASSGLGLQILERQTDANVIWPPGNSMALAEAQRVCANWNSWAYDCSKAWPGQQGTDDKGNPVYPTCDNATELQNDAGI